jgi:hypothetical protein
VTPEQFRLQVRDRVQDFLARDEEEYLGSRARLHKISLDGPDGNLNVVFADASRPGHLNVWTWAFPNLPPAGHTLTVEDIHGYAGWVVSSLREAVATRQGVRSTPNEGSAS